MKIIKQITFISFLLVLLSCTKSRGYETIDELYIASFKAIKSKDKKGITEFVSDMIPDKNTAKYMESNECVYRGFPRVMKEHPYVIDSAIVEFTDYYMNLASSLEKRYGNLDNLRFIGFERAISPEPLNESECECEDILFEEPWGIFVSENNKDTLRFNIGEVLKVDGKWKVFTEPKI
ncbi:hypothetical protein [Flavobacterium sp. AJR]|uniref:hypothetical protein n=1 Tax=unclassified Flavobacterium TaxID=196869 RepID=UPI000A3D82B5|nr:hypothetical protein [Flavobacterium sp. AJR]OUL64430.1 hypothetical protein B8T70_00420 [Flavobacterium sp. AJR]